MASSSWQEQCLVYAPVLRMIVLALIGFLAFFIRIFSVIRYESVIHEFDPWFNYRSTKYMAENGFDAFFSWNDFRAWYPFGRFVGGSMFPGLFVVSTTIHNLLHMIGIPIEIRNMCVFLAPLFAAFTAFATYCFTK